jgi:hypothetical protein
MALALFFHEFIVVGRAGSVIHLQCPFVPSVLTTFVHKHFAMDVDLTES